MRNIIFFQAVILSVATGLISTKLCNRAQNMETNTKSLLENIVSNHMLQKTLNNII